MQIGTIPRFGKARLMLHHLESQDLGKHDAEHRDITQHEFEICTVSAIPSEGKKHVGSISLVINPEAAGSQDFLTLRLGAPKTKRHLTSYLRNGFPNTAAPLKISQPDQGLLSAIFGKKRPIQTFTTPDGLKMDFPRVNNISFVLDTAHQEGVGLVKKARLEETRISTNEDTMAQYQYPARIGLKHLKKAWQQMIQAAYLRARAIRTFLTQEN